MTEARSKATPEEESLFSLSWPIFVEMALMTAIGTLCLWLAGTLSVGAVAIFGLSNQFRLVLDRIFRVVSIGASVLVTQHRGAGDAAGAIDLARAGFTTALWLGAAAALLLGAWPEGMLRLLNLPPELMAEAAPFMRVLAVGLAIEAVNLTMFSVLRAFKYTQVSMRLVMAENALHLIVAVPLVLGAGSWPGLGLIGLAWGFLVSRAVIFVLLIVVWRQRLQIGLRLRDAFRIAREPLRAIARLGLPSAGEKIIFRVCFMATVAMAGSMGAAALATHAWTMNIMSVVFTFVGALSAGAEILIGHRTGAGHVRAADDMIRHATRLGLIGTIVLSILTWLVAPHLIFALSHDPTVKTLLSSILLIEIFAAAGRSANVTLMGGLRATGDAVFPVQMSVFFNVVMGTGLAWLLGVFFGLGLPGLWLGYLADESLRGLGMFWRWKTHGWVPLAHESRRRILRRLRTA
ncbi:MATE family efflux transporter [Viridibacterium curvum]|uniref:MATE family efflux transporter n=1 Tax=Viridibacterium curvum TaxID=1101404 RepID=A0ABP9QF84_9RHOO